MIATPLQAIDVEVEMESQKSSLEKGSANTRRRGVYPSEKTRVALSSSRRRRQRHVTFNNNGIETQHPAPAEHSEVDSLELWYSSFEFQLFSTVAQHESRFIRPAHETHLIGLDQTHSIAILLADSCNKKVESQGVMDRIYKKLDVRNSGLAAWTTQTPHRGLERVASKQLKHAKRSVRTELRSIVVPNACNENVSTGSRSTTHTVSSQEPRERPDPEVLAAQCELISKQSRIFARMIGLADELAAQQAYC